MSECYDLSIGFILSQIHLMCAHKSMCSNGEPRNDAATASALAISYATSAIDADRITHTRRHVGALEQSSQRAMPSVECSCSSTAGP
jgi:hypothetical protein